LSKELQMMGWEPVDRLPVIQASVEAAQMW